MSTRCMTVRGGMGGSTDQYGTLSVATILSRALHEVRRHEGRIS